MKKNSESRLKLSPDKFKIVVQVIGTRCTICLKKDPPVSAGTLDTNICGNK